MTLMGGQAGILQGERRWLPLAGIYLGMGLGRIAFGSAAIALDPDTLGAMTGVAVGAVVPVVVGSFALRHRSRVSSRLERAGNGAAPGVGRSRRVLRELAHNSHALLAFFALSNVDVVIARVMLDDHQGGLYAGGLILAAEGFAPGSWALEWLARDVVYRIAIGVACGVGIGWLLALVFLHGAIWSALMAASGAYATAVIPPARRAEGLGEPLLGHERRFGRQHVVALHLERVERVRGLGVALGGGDAGLGDRHDHGVGHAALGVGGQWGLLGQVHFGRLRLVFR